MNVRTYGIVAILCKVALFASFITVTFLTNKALGFAVTAVSVLGFISEELKYRAQMKEQEQAASELMQMLAAKSGTGSC
jgi:hypothetical protein